MSGKKTETRKTLADFRAIHDKDFVIPNKIKAGLDALGSDGWEYEVDFIRICGCSTTDFAKFRDKFEDFYVTTSGTNPKRVWAGSKALAAKMREMV